MSEHRTFKDRTVREATFEEKVTLKQLQDAGIEDVFIQVETADQRFWNSVTQAVEWSIHVLTDGRVAMDKDWCREVAWHLGDPPGTIYTQNDVLRTLTGHESAARKLSLIELMLDHIAWGSSAKEFRERFNDAAVRYRVAVRLEENRFIPIESEEIHERVVRPVLALLRGKDFESADALYRKAWDRILAGDPSGAITAATTAVEETLRAMGYKGSDLGDLLKSARKDGSVSAGAQQLLDKLYAFRGASDAHTAGTDQLREAHLVVHAASSMILYVSQGSRAKAVSSL